ncbi:MAG: exodeoxyribonuclease VII small subunit [bacterium]|nr:exodeoxyribonuclease VII small subunit [bacterium]
MAEKPKRTAGETAEPGSFEEAITRLEALVAGLEAGEVPLEQSVKSFEEGRRLIAYCEGKLKMAEQALRQIARDEDETGNETR